MKKGLFLLALLCCVTITNAQTIEKKNQWAIEAGVGGNGATTINLGIRWQRNFHPYVSWDILSANFVSNIDMISDVIMPQIMTGIRLYSPSFSGMKVYAIGRAGYGGSVCSNEDYQGDGIVFEVGGGLHLNKHLYIGYAYNHQDLGSVEVIVDKKHTASVDKESKYHSFRIGWIF